MIQDFKDILIRWNNTTNERQKLQHTYMAAIVLVIIVAGVVSLVRADLGHDITRVAVFGFAAFLANALVWNLLNSMLLTKLGKPVGPVAARVSKPVVRKRA